MKITKKLAYGVSEDVKESLLYPKRIILRNYKEPKNIETFLEVMSNFKIYQYNYNKSQDSDYFMWQYVNDKWEKDYTHVDLCVYQNNMESIYKMYNLLNICESLYTDIDVEVQYDNIENLINKIKEDD